MGLWGCEPSFSVSVGSSKFTGWEAYVWEAYATGPFRRKTNLSRGKVNKKRFPSAAGCEGVRDSGLVGLGGFSTGFSGYSTIRAKIRLAGLFRNGVVCYFSRVIIGQLFRFATSSLPKYSAGLRKSLGGAGESIPFPRSQPVLSDPDLSCVCDFPLNVYALAGISNGNTQIRRFNPTG